MPKSSDFGQKKEPNILSDQPGTSASTLEVFESKKPAKRDLTTHRFLKSRRLHESVEPPRTHPFVTNWTINVFRNSPLALYSGKYSNKESLRGYVYTGEKEVDRITNTLKRLGELPPKLLDSLDEDEFKEKRKSIEEDLEKVDLILEGQSQDNGKMKAVGWLADKISWRHLPLVVRQELMRQSPGQTFETKNYKKSELTKEIWPNHPDWLDDWDIMPPPGDALFENIEDPNHYDRGEPPIPCCIFTKHRNGKISRCLREPIKGFNSKLCQKSIRKQLPFFWSKTVISPAVCSFHYQIIENEKKNTEDNPLFERPLGKYETTEPVKFDNDAQFEEVSEYINDALEKTRDEHREALSFNTRFWKLMDPPKSRDPLRKVKALERPQRSYDGMTPEDIEKLVNETEKGKKKKLLTKSSRVHIQTDANGFEIEEGKRKSKRKTSNQTVDSDGIGSFSSEEDTEYLTDIELNDKLSGWLSPKPRCRYGPLSPEANRFIEDESKDPMAWKKNRIQKSFQYNFLIPSQVESKDPKVETKKEPKKAMPSPRPTTSKHAFDEETVIANLPMAIQHPKNGRLELDSSSEEEDYESDRVLRVFGLVEKRNASGKVPDPKLSFDGCSGATIRRIKKHYNLPNRSGATSKSLLLEGLHEFFTESPVDYIKTMSDFIAHTKEPRPPLGQTPPHLSSNTPTGPNTSSNEVSPVALPKKRKYTRHDENYKNQNNSESSPKKKLLAKKINNEEKTPDVNSDMSIREHLKIQMKLQKRKEEISLEATENSLDDISEQGDIKQEEEVIEEGVVYPPTADGGFETITFQEPVNASLDLTPQPSVPKPTYNLPTIPSTSYLATSQVRRNGVSYIAGGIGINHQNTIKRHISPQPSNSNNSITTQLRPNVQYYQPKTFTQLNPSTILSTKAENNSANEKQNKSSKDKFPRPILSASHKT
ncbi:unnamed protein product [Bursaphelenchus xylophilus]|uniref:(pine wood nematode) hypothetical protein n=1 Tax=Bursaphelenchus xylophilus TaxID=6326 RepID=A0A1I7S095_BURXY|nr:unnamed protein product [Bursaphelenchus xylophilus]CAG9108939.1 unnamed protein product [Bursaphelenchus xylophilus]